VPATAPDSPATTLYLVRHAESAPDFSIAEANWPLSANGSKQAQRLGAQLRVLTPDHLISSPYRRAIDTLEPFSRHTGLSIRIEADLRERHLFDGRVENRDKMMRGLWADLDSRMPNCESGTDCRLRVTRCLTALVDASPGKTLVASSHGNAIALFLHGIEASFGYDDWKRMRNPDVFRVVRRERCWDWARDFSFDGAPPERCATPDQA
jgi:2,3-bisphosphoglycerate-dependent phosphoglycerate mutase